MSGPSTRLDVRLPIGGLFIVLGLLIGGYGLATASDSALYVRSLSVNINLWWGVVMFWCGVAFVTLALRARP
jgi:hypothetical protein